MRIRNWFTYVGKRLNAYPWGKQIPVTIVTHSLKGQGRYTPTDMASRNPDTDVRMAVSYVFTLFCCCIRVIIIA